MILDVVTRRSPVVTKSANYTLTTSDGTVICTSGTFTLTLPTAVNNLGLQFQIKNSGSGTITIATTSSQTIDEATSLTLAQYDCLVVLSDGSNWVIT